MISGFDPAPESDPALHAPVAFSARRQLTWQIMKLVLAALLAYAIWRTYQNPDLMLDLSSWRLC